MMGMRLTIHEQDVCSALCTQCAACCRIFLNLRSTDSRYRKFLRGIGLQLTCNPKGSNGDCCDDVHDVRVDMGPCLHLERGDRGWVCKLYGMASYPQLCKDFNCVSWAKARNVYNSRNKTLAAAQATLDKLMSPFGAMHVTNVHSDMSKSEAPMTPGAGKPSARSVGEGGDVAHDAGVAEEHG